MAIMDDPHPLTLGVIQMPSLSRRSFLGASLAGLAASSRIAAQKTADPLVKVTDDFAFQPNTLFLTRRLRDVCEAAGFEPIESVPTGRT
jgi:hypothetical protein